MNAFTPLYRRVVRSAMVCAVVGLVAGRSFVAGSEPARHFPADGPETPAYSVPDPLISANGQRITTAEEWTQRRRPEVLELFREHVYGRAPTRAYQQTFKVVNEDRNAMNGAATLRQVAITLSAEGKSVTINLSLFVPNHARKPVPAFLLICNRSIDNIDPTRAKKSEFWPAEEGIARGYAMAAFFNGDVAPDKKRKMRSKRAFTGCLNRRAGPTPGACWRLGAGVRVVVWTIW